MYPSTLREEELKNKVAADVFGDYDCTRILDADFFLADLLSKDGATLVLCPASKQTLTVPEGVTAIGESAFQECAALESVSFPSGMTEIGDRAFYDCTKLKSVLIGAEVTAVGDGAFSGCISLEKIDVDGENKEYSSADGVLFSKDGSSLVGCPGARSEVTIPAGVTAVDDWAFPGCASLSAVKVDPANNYFVSLGNMLFSKDGKTLLVCPGVKKEAEIPDGVTKIADNAFARCKSLKSVSIPESVTDVGKDAFYGCTSLKTVNYAAGRGEWEKISVSDESDAFKAAEVFTKTERTNAIIIFAVLVAALAAAIVVLYLIRKNKKAPAKER